MPIRFNCSSCGKLVRAPDGLAGKRAQCAGCGAVIVIPDATPLRFAEEGRGASSPPTSPAVPPVSSPPPLPAATRDAMTFRTEAPPENAAAALDELKAAYADFSRPIGRINLGFGCLAMLVIAGAIYLGVSLHWAAGVFGGLATVIFLVILSKVCSSPHNQDAKDAVAAIEAECRLTHDDSLALLLSDEKTMAGSECKEFVTQVWGASGAALLDKKKAALAPPAPVEAPRPPQVSTGTVSENFVCGQCGAALAPTSAGGTIRCASCSAELLVPAHCACPGCGSANTEWKTETKGGNVGAIVGGLLFGFVGSLIGGAATTSTTHFYQCKDCSRKWALRLPVVPR